MTAVSVPRTVPGRALRVQKRYGIAGSFRALMAAVIDRAMSDLKGLGPRCRAIETDRAMAFVLSSDCEIWCLELGIDYETIRKQAAALYRRFLEEAGDSVRAPGRPRKSGAGTGKPRSMTRPESQPQSVRRQRAAMLDRKG
jgi:hypothetical protein